MNAHELIARHEGRRLTPYRCPAGARTIGVGWNLDANAPPDDIARHLQAHGSITDAMADRLLKISVRRAVADCRVLFPAWDGIDPARRMALTDFVFQLGFARARCFVHAIAAINTRRWDDAARHLLDSAWARQTPRRAREVAEIIETGEIDGIDD
ncbi:MAG: glycoside hydrolase family protein [Kiritimatiellae bacterium]|nr:glycoside hydrolase family protein [Kiritimatiellia bacterium]